MSFFSIEGSGILSNILTVVLNRPNVKLTNNTVVINYRSTPIGVTSILSFTIGLEFTNYSSQQNFVTDFNGRYYNGKEWFELAYYHDLFSPSFKLESKNIATTKFDLYPIMKELPLPLIELYSRRVHIDLRYKIGRKQKAVFINNLRANEVSNPLDKHFF